MLAASDEGLLPRQAIDVAVFHRLRLDPLNVGAAGRFGHREGADHFAGGHLGEPAFFLLFRPAVQDVMGDDAGMDRLAPGGKVVVVLDEAQDRLMPEIAARAAVFLGDGRAEEAHFARLVPDLTLHDPGLAPAFGARDPFGFQKAAGRILKHHMVFVHPVGFEAFELHFPLPDLLGRGVPLPSRPIPARG